MRGNLAAIALLPGNPTTPAPHPAFGHLPPKGEGFLAIQLFPGVLFKLTRQQLLQNVAAAVFCALILAGMCKLDTIGIAQRIPCKTMIHKLSDNFAVVFLLSAAKSVY